MKRLLIITLAGLAVAGCSDDTELDSACLADLECSAHFFMVKADLLCKERIIKLSPPGLKWVESRSEPLLADYAWKDKAAGIIAYSGKKARVPDANGNYVTEKYECDINPGDKKSPVVDVRVSIQKS